MVHVDIVGGVKERGWSDHDLDLLLTVTDEDAFESFEGNEPPYAQYLRQAGLVEQAYIPSEEESVDMWYWPDKDVIVDIFFKEG